MHFIYILKCADGLYYTGLTGHLTDRLREHRMGKARFTQSRLPFELVYTERLQDLKQAVKREKQIKGWSRNKKEALIQGDKIILPILARKAKWSLIRVGRAKPGRIENQELRA